MNSVTALSIARDYFFFWEGINLKLKRDHVGVDLLEKYLAEASDFSFELQILEMLSARGIECEHGGQYKDPETGKFREFDIRARFTSGDITLAAAIECKSIGQHFPLLVSCVPRKETESFHEVFVHLKRETRQRGMFDLPEIDFPEGKEGERVSQSSLYPLGGPVGKSTAQVGRRDTRDGELTANDAEFFEKWTQALQSLDDLIVEIASDEMIEARWDGKLHVSLALPIVVVPNETLWAVNYAGDGSRDGAPSRVDRVSIFIGRSYHNSFPPDSIQISHLEIMTQQGLANFCDNYLNGEAAMTNFLSRRE